MAQVTPDAMSEALDFNNIKRRAVASRNFRTKINPVGPSSVTVTSAGSQIEFMLPSNLAGSYMDFSQMYLKFKLKVTGADTNFDKCGAYGIINRLEMFSSGSQIFTLNNYNVLAATLLDTDATIGYKGGVGKVLAGLQANGSLGERLIDGLDRTFCLPMILNPFAMQKKLVPLFSLDSIRMRFTLESFTNTFVGAGVTSYTISDVQLCGYICELSPSAQAQIDDMTDGVYRLLCPSYTNVQTTMIAASAVTATLGVAVSSLERILVVHRIATSSLANQTLGARITNGLTSFQFSIDSQLYPQAPIQIADGAAEPLAEFLISSHALSDFQNDAHINSQLYSKTFTINTSVVNQLISPYEGLYSYLNINASNTSKNCWNNAVGDGTLYSLAAATDGTASQTGSFVASIELETSVSAAKSDRLYSGISTIGSVVQYIGNYSGSVAATIDFFCHYTILCTLDMKRLGVWTVSV